MDQLWTLDVDDTIWQDAGLTDARDGKPIPRWLGDEGICAMLEQDRCQEEITRLQHKRDALQDWFAKEWDVILCAIQTAGASSNVQVWGPDEAAISSVGLNMRREHVLEVELSMKDEDGSDVDDGGSTGDEEDYQLIEHLETLELVDDLPDDA
ncbi:hypothetical protein V5O48_010560 [Marasmius crinis-equi]|uniref:Uncharacterized protein n=1 Tax=Marasmius crinis-equi TaxID=585013 RepID=A0ABR3F842_9AGAR